VQRKQRPHVRIVPGAWHNQAVFEGLKCQKVRHSSLVLCLRANQGGHQAVLKGREAEAYWDSLTQEQEVWALTKMGYFKIGRRT
jgi:hypothetical protein